MQQSTIVQNPDGRLAVQNTLVPVHTVQPVQIVQAPKPTIIIKEEGGDDSQLHALRAEIEMWKAKYFASQG